MLMILQERIAKSFGSQCGFCTPGIVMSMYTLLRNNPQPSAKDMESAFEGNKFNNNGKVGNYWLVKHNYILIIDVGKVN